jgi:hypothetical protein
MVIASIEVKPDSVGGRDRAPCGVDVLEDSQRSSETFAEAAQ